MKGQHAVDDDDAFTCGVCLETYTESGSLQPLSILPCGHASCLRCLLAIEQHNRICPTCRMPFKGPVLRFPRNFALLQLMRREARQEASRSNKNSVAHSGSAVQQQGSREPREKREKMSNVSNVSNEELRAELVWRGEGKDGVGGLAHIRKSPPARLTLAPAPPSTLSYPTAPSPAPPHAPPQPSPPPLAWLSKFGMTVDTASGSLEGSSSGAAAGSAGAAVKRLRFLPTMGPLIGGKDQENLRKLSRVTGCTVRILYDESPCAAHQQAAGDRRRSEGNAGVLTMSGTAKDVATCMWGLDAVMRGIALFKAIPGAFEGDDGGEGGEEARWRGREGKVLAQQAAIAPQAPSHLPSSQQPQPTRQAAEIAAAAGAVLPGKSATMPPPWLWRRV